MSHVSFFMQISAAIIEKSIFYYISASIAENRQNKMYRPMLWGSATIVKLLLTWSHMSLKDSLICKLLPPLSKNLFCTISRPILHITVQTRCPCQCFQRQRSSKDHSWIDYMCSWHAMQIIKFQHYRKCDLYAVSQPILHVSWEGFLRASTYEIVLFLRPKVDMGWIQGIVNKEIQLSSFANSFTDPGKQPARMIFSYLPCFNLPWASYDKC